jgi:hypothetical protein
VEEGSLPVKRIEIPGNVRPNSVAKLGGTDIVHRLHQQEDHVSFTLDKEVTISPERELILEC